MTEKAETSRILVVDDDRGPREALSILLEKEGYEVRTASRGDVALEMFLAARPELVLADIRMPGMDGIELLARVKEIDSRQMVVIMTAHSDWPNTVEAMRLGAFDYIQKPYDNDGMRYVVRRALELAAQLKARGDRDIDEINRNLLGNDDSIRRVARIVRQIAPTDGTVLIHGPSGTGKELVAHMVHRLSGRAGGAFVVVNCGSFTESLLESELFGHVAGAFTGATGDKMGVLEAADGGTLFLDEVGEMSAATQVKFLRVMQEREVKPVGGTQLRRIDVRFVAATNRDLEEMVREGTFRADLYYRLNVIPILLPPLADRRTDLPLLAGHFLEKYSRALGKAVVGFETAAMEALAAHDWPGNVRELENAVHRAVAFCDKDRIRREDLGEKLGRLHGEDPALRRQGLAPLLPPEGLDLECHLAAIEKGFLKAALDRTGGHLTNAAKLLGLSFRSMRYKVKKYGLKGVQDEE